jgi:hypothetical protein
MDDVIPAQVCAHLESFYFHFHVTRARRSEISNRLNLPLLLLHDGLRIVLYRVLVGLALFPKNE